MMTFRRMLVTRTALLDRAMRLCLIISLWPAPAPWVHCHHEEDSLGPQLASHLNEYHARERAESHEGWHLHFAYLWQLAGDPNCPDDREEPPPCQRPATPAASSPTFALTAATTIEPAYAVIPEGPPAAQVTTRETAARYVCPGSFLHSFAGVIAPHQLLGVLLC
jgi:hypothetical protein